MQLSSARNKELQPTAGVRDMTLLGQHSALQHLVAKLATSAAVSQAVITKHVVSPGNPAKAACPARQGFLYSAPSLQAPLRASR